MKPDLNAKDIQGFTPLHIAVTAVHKLGSTRSVKALLLKGADREALDNKNKRAIDLISNEMPENLQRELVQYLSN
jgi:ankyrin repeat protein